MANGPGDKHYSQFLTCQKAVALIDLKILKTQSLSSRVTLLDHQ